MHAMQCGIFNMSCCVISKKIKQAEARAISGLLQIRLPDRLSRARGSCINRKRIEKGHERADGKAFQVRAELD